VFALNVVKARTETGMKTTFVEATSAYHRPTAVIRVDVRLDANVGITNLYPEATGSLNRSSRQTRAKTGLMRRSETSASKPSAIRRPPCNRARANVENREPI
jgi:hypothetical protein